MSSSPTTRRVTTSVDLGDLRDRLIEVSAAVGVGPSTWIRELVRRELSADGSPEGLPMAAKAVATASDSVYRTWLDGELTAKLDLLTERGGFKNRASTLRAILEGVNVGSANVSLSEAVEAMGLSNHYLVAIGRNVNQVARALHGSGDKALTADRIALDEALRAIHKHLDVASALVGELRPMFKSKGETS